MTAAFSPADRQRLGKLLAMLGSSFAGERDAAGQAAHKMVTAAGLCWQDVVAPTALPAGERSTATPPPPPSPCDTDIEWRLLAGACFLGYADRLNDWERGFLGGLKGRLKLTDKQHAVLLGIVKRLRAAGCDV